MKIRHTAIFITAILSSIGAASAQTGLGKKMNPSYVDGCIQNQVQVHQNLQGLTPNDFRAHCECTAKQLSNSLSSAQLDELNKGNKSPTWFKSVEDSASKSCLKPEAKTQT